MPEHICPHCRQPIHDDDALLCHFCGESLNRPGSGITGWMRGASGLKKWVLVWIVVVMILGFLFLVGH